MSFQDYITKQITLQTSKKRILFIDGGDHRAQAAALMHKKHNLIVPILLLEKGDEKVVDPMIQTLVIKDWQDRQKILINKYLEARKGKETSEQAKKVIFDKNFFAMLMLALGEVDGVVGGLQAPTADILRAAFKVIGPKPGVKTISSAMILEKEDQWFIFSDISVNIEPSLTQLVDIGINASELTRTLNLEPRVAFLSFSTSNSADHPKSNLVREATRKFNGKYFSAVPAIGEVQFDAAFSPEIRSKKYHDPSFEEQASVFVFPDLNAANIGYKIAQRMGNYGAVGPIITGVNLPVNDLSRGAKIDDVYQTALLTALQASQK